ncbi:MAG: hypothetical protein H6934_05930 [Burkholderiaceae bacterium]|nr:hypothetical protein [Burkholderiaceae bacterium]
MVLHDSIDVDAPASTQFDFFEGMSLERYLAWRPDHKVFRWTEGSGVEIGNRWSQAQVELPGLGADRPADRRAAEDLRQRGQYLRQLHVGTGGRRHAHQRRAGRGGTHSLAIANGSNIQPGGAGSGCLTFAGPAVTAHNVTRLVGILTQCASGPQRAPLVTLSVREELGDPTVFAAYAAPTRPITVEDTTYGLVSRICATAAAQ